MPKVISSGEVKIYDKVYNLKDFDDLGSFSKVDNNFYGHMTHESIQANEESVHVSGDGFSDSSVPKTPKTDCFYSNVSNWKR